MTAEESRRPLALVTGASTGIGEALARRLAAAGHDVVLVARNAERLDAVAREIQTSQGVTAHVMPRDLSEVRAPDDIYRTLSDQGMRVDVLVNNAGFGGYGFFQDTDLIHELEMIQVNVTALVHLAKLFLRDMVARGSGQIALMGSLAGYRGFPRAANYAPTKAAIRSLAECLRFDLEEKGIDMSGQRPKDVTDYLGRKQFDYVIIVCDGANRSCPSVFPGVGHRLFWPFDDPAAFEGGEEETLEGFRRVRDQIDARIQTWLEELSGL